MSQKPSRVSPLIRLAEEADWPVWRDLWQGYCDFYKATVGDDVTAETWRRCLDTSFPALRCLVAESRLPETHGQLVGFATLLEHPGTWSIAPVGYLEDLFVAPEARRQGVADALMRACAETGRCVGWTKLYWRTDHANATAQALYDRLGKRTNWLVYDWILSDQ